MKVRIALAQVNPTVGDFTGNAAKIIEFARHARQGRADLVLFPELSVCGYPPRDLVEKPDFVDRCRQSLEEIAAQTRDIVCVCGFVSRACYDTGKSVMNSAAVLRDGAVALVQSKRLLPTYDVFDEMRNFAPAERQELFTLDGKKAGPHDLRRRMERQDFLEPQALHGRPGGRTYPRGRRSGAEHLRLSLPSGQAGITAGDAGLDRPPSSGSGGDGEPGGRKRQSRLRRLKRGHRRTGRGPGAGETSRCWSRSAWYARSRYEAAAASSLRMRRCAPRQWMTP